MGRVDIGYAVRKFTDGDEHPVFWGYFPDYDWVAFNWLFGHMDELPFHYPQLCLDIKQWAIELGDPELPQQQGSGTTRYPTPDGRGMLGSFSLASIPLPASGGLSVASILTS